VAAIADLVVDDTGVAGPPEGEVPAAEGGGSRLDPWVLRVAFILAVLPLVASAIAMLVAHRGYTPTGDLALTEMLTRDVGQRWLELGPYSRDGWFHPGPAMFYLLAGPYRLTGGQSVGMNVAALAVNATAIAGMAFIARRRGPVLALLTLVGCALLIRSLGVDPVRLPWNPWVTVLPYGLLVFLTVAMAWGDRWALPVAVAVASFLGQTHIGYVALATPLVVIGAVWLLVVTPTGTRRKLVLPGFLAALVGALMWLPPVLQQVTNTPGNLGVVVRWFGDGGPNEEKPQTLRAGWRIVSSQFGATPEWLFGSRGTIMTAEPTSMYKPLLPILLLVVAGAIVVLWRRRVPGSPQMVLVWLAASVIGVLATARTVGPIFAYRVGWAWLLGMLGIVLVAWAGWRALTDWRPALERRLLVPLALVALVVMAVVNSVAHVRAGEPHEVSSHRVRELVPQVVEALPPGDGEIIVDGPGFLASGLASGVVLELEKKGYDARVPTGNFAYGPSRTEGDGPFRARYTVAVDGEILQAEKYPGMELVAYDGDFSLAELRRRAPATDALMDVYEGADPSVMAEFGPNAKFISTNSAVAVFAETEPTPP
jgi:hypothetical protein